MQSDIKCKPNVTHVVVFELVATSENETAMPQTIYAVGVKRLQNWVERNMPL